MFDLLSIRSALPSLEHSFCPIRLSPLPHSLDTLRSTLPRTFLLPDMALPHHLFPVPSRLVQMFAFPPPYSLSARCALCHPSPEHSFCPIWLSPLPYSPTLLNPLKCSVYSQSSPIASPSSVFSFSYSLNPSKCSPCSQYAPRHPPPKHFFCPICPSPLPYSPTPSTRSNVRLSLNIVHLPPLS